MGETEVLALVGVLTALGGLVGTLWRAYRKVRSEYVDKVEYDRVVTERDKALDRLDELYGLTDQSAKVQRRLVRVARERGIEPQGEEE